MSNSVVGSVYEQIIEDVLTTSRVDFEENGVDEGVLDELRRGWQRKLTQFNVAQFPWDPSPDAEASAAGTGAPGAPPGKTGPGKATPPPSSADHSFSQPIMSPGAGSQGLALPSLPMPSFEPHGIKAEDGSQSTGHRIKTEPDTQGSGFSGLPLSMPMPAPPSFPTTQGGGAANAAARAAAMLSKEFGSAANASINAINTQQQQNRGHVNGMAKSQYDGAAEDAVESSDAGAFDGVLLQQQRAGQPPVELGRVEIDSLLHEQMARRAQQMEGGGLMLPLKKQARRASRKRDRQRRAGAAAAAAAAATAATCAGAGGAPAPAQPRTAIAQVDGMDDDDDDDDAKGDILDDEDAINSDLDDPDDEREDDDDDDDVMGPIMLCVYDKVQRVKNKWKCTLKDGVLTVNGKEYVFHKATGEYEW